jgi:hypothetical protein
MTRLMLAAAALLAFATSAHAQSPSCTTPSPGSAWVCVSGGWLPPGHPDIPSTPKVDAPTPNQPQPAVAFRIGHRYVRTTTDVYIMGAGQTAEGVNVLFAQCRTVGDGCYEAGMIRLFLANANAVGWDDRTSSPY